MLNTVEGVSAQTSAELQRVVRKFKLKASAYFVNKLTIEMVSHLVLRSRSLGSVCSFRQLSDGGIELLLFERADNKRAIQAINSAGLGLCAELKNGGVYVSPPVVTSERRRMIIKSLFSVLEQFKLSVRAIRRRSIGELKLIKSVGCDIKRVCLKRVEGVVFKALAELQQIYDANERRLASD